VSAPRWTEYQSIGGLTPADRNAKDHDQGSLDASVGTFGFMEPVVIDERTGQIVSGHGRVDYLQARHAEGKPVPEGVVVADDGTWETLVVRGWSSKDDQHAVAAGIALNRVGERGGWKFDELALHLDDLTLHDTDDLLAATGFSQQDLDDFKLLTPDLDLDALEDEFGHPTEEDGMTQVKIDCTLEVANRWRALTRNRDPGDVLADAMALMPDV
jgi:hypothetical protein